MNRWYKKSYLIINIILIVCVLVSLFNFFWLKINNYVYSFLAALIPFIILYLCLGYEKKKRRFTYETMFYVFAYVVLLLIIIYILGIFIGFSQNVYKLNMSNIMNNVIPYIFVIFMSEIFRYEIIRKGDGSLLSYILVTFFFIVIDSTMFMNTYDLTMFDGIIKFVCLIVFPSIFKNILMVFLGRNGGPHPCILYRLLMDLRIFLLPILPNFGMYFDSIVYTCLPVLVLGFIFLSLKQFKNKEVGAVKIKSTKMYKYIFIVIILLFTIGINILGSCRFKYAMIAIGSDSMNPVFYRGDAILFENTKDIDRFNVGDILVFKKDTKTVVHRIIDIKNIEGEKIFYTKGDNNNGPDGYPITQDSVIGLYKNRIKYIGLISVNIKDLFSS